MKRMLFLLLFLPTLGLTCQDHPTEMKSQPLWVQALLKAAGGHKHHKHEDLNPKEVKEKKSPENKKASK